MAEACYWEAWLDRAAIVAAAPRPASRVDRNILIGPPRTGWHREPARGQSYFYTPGTLRPCLVEAVTKLGVRDNISGNGLAKACRRADIPVPPRGYWARAAAPRQHHKWLFSDLRSVDHQLDANYRFDLRVTHERHQPGMRLGPLTIRPQQPLQCAARREWKR